MSVALQPCSGGSVLPHPTLFGLAMQTNEAWKRPAYSCTVVPFSSYASKLTFRAALSARLSVPRQWQRRAQRPRGQRPPRRERGPWRPRRQRQGPDEPPGYRQPEPADHHGRAGLCRRQRTAVAILKLLILRQRVHQVIGQEM